MPNGIKSKKDIAKEAKAAVPAMSAEELKNRLIPGHDFILLDVRDEGEVKAGFISGSTWISRGKLEFLVEDKITDPAQEIIVYCKTGARSALSVKALLDMGYTNVTNLDGGFEGWAKAGYPIYNMHGEIRVVEFDKKDPCAAMSGVK